MITRVRVNGKVKYRIISHQTGKNLGTYNTRAAAQRRLNQIKKFK